MNHELKILTNKVNFAKVDSMQLMKSWNILKYLENYLENLITKTYNRWSNDIVGMMNDDGWKESSADYE